MPFLRRLVRLIAFVFALLTAGAAAQSALPQRVIDGLIAEYGTTGAAGIALPDDAPRACPAAPRLPRARIPAPTAADLVIGPGRDTLRVTADREQRGTIYVVGDGVLMVDHAVLTVAAHLALAGRGRAFLRNGARLHFDQQFVGQCYVYLADSARFDAEDATVDANGVMHFVELHGRSAYVARRTEFPDWTFRTVVNQAVLELEDVRHVGDFLVDDSCRISLRRCDTLMPWMQVKAGMRMDLRLPDPSFVAHHEIAPHSPDVQGIAWSLTVDSCHECWWSLESFPGSSIAVRGSVIRGCAVRIPGSDSMGVAGVFNYHWYPRLSLPLPDRALAFDSSYVTWWNWYPMRATVFRMDSCSFGEMVGKGSSLTYATRSVHDGMTILLGTIDTAVMVYANGVSQAFAATWDRSTLLFLNSAVTPLRPYQKTNIAHNASNFLCVNSRFVSKPFAMDAAQVLFAAIDSVPPVPQDADVAVNGGAWVHGGPQSGKHFTKYELSWVRYGRQDWQPGTVSFAQVDSGLLGVWNTRALPPGLYVLRLVVWNNAGDSLTALRGVIITPPSSADAPAAASAFRLSAYPNPCDDVCHLTLRAAIHTDMRIFLYDLLGRPVRELPALRPVDGMLTMDLWTGGLPPGAYLCVARGARETARLLLRVR
jgi:hypothetical protein